MITTIKWRVLKRDTKRLIDLAMEISGEYEKKISSEKVLDMMMELICR